MFIHFQKVLLILVLCLSQLNMQAQSVKELEKQRKQALKVLETTSKMLNETKKSQKSSLNKLTIINRNITERKSLIKNINTEINKLDSEVNRLNQEKRVLENRLTILKKDYARLVQEAHMNRSVYAKIMFVLSAKSFDQSYRRMRYLQEYQDYRKVQVAKIEGVKVSIIQKSDSLTSHKKTKVQVVKQKEAETAKLSTDEKKEKTLLTDLKKKEGKLRADLKIQQKKAAELNSRIERIIAEEIRKAEARKAAENKRLAAAENKKSSSASGEKPGTSKTERTESKPTQQPKGNISALTKEESLISGNFAANQGRLPWPTTNGYISGRYGVQPHPVLKHVTTNNKGIYIQTTAGSSVRAVFEGKVTQIFYIQGNNGVIIQHGNYRTVYANLSQISVREGENVSAKQNIGRVFTDADNDNKTELYFQIYNGRSVMNPESWIAR
jgi:murein hydrolase activator